MTNTLNYFNYFSEIEETFIRRRGKSLFLSPLDWALMESWQEREIPLHIVLRGIETVFDNYEKSPKKRSVKSLSFCTEEVEAQYKEWLESQVGKSTKTETQETDAMFSEKTVAEHLDNILRNLELAKRKTNIRFDKALDGIISRLSELKGNYSSAENLENALTDLEKLLDKNLLENTEKELLERTKAETENEMRHYRQQMEEEVFQKNFDLLLLKKLRMELGVPRLSLFYL